MSEVARDKYFKNVFSIEKFKFDHLKICDEKATKTAETKYNIANKYLAFISPISDRFAASLLREGGSWPNVEDF